MKILVTGGAGFIGSAVVRHIINNTQDIVINIDKLTYAGNLESLIDIENNMRYTFEHADICDSKTMARIFADHQPDAVMHLAADRIDEAAAHRSDIAQAEHARDDFGEGVENLGEQQVHQLKNGNHDGRDEAGDDSLFYA